MLNKIQQQLLLKYPLLWNTRIVPVILASIIIHLLVFLSGYAVGGIDFNSGRNKYLDDEILGTIVFVSTIMAVLILIAWLVFYFRNNRTKSFYPLGKNDLYKEWLLIVIICLANCTYFLSYVTGTNARLKGYMSREEFEHRTEIIAMAEIFTGEGNYDYGYSDSIASDGDMVTYFGKKYSYYSLMNRRIQHFPHYDNKRDSIISHRVKLWLHENRKDSVLWMMQEMEKIVKAHNMKMSVTPQEWLGLTYNPTAFTEFTYINERDRYTAFHGYNDEYNSRYDYSYGRYGYNDGPVSAENIKSEKLGDSILITDGYDSTKIDLVTNEVKFEKGLPYVYPKKYVPLHKIRDAYEKISYAYNFDEAYWIGWAGLTFFAVTLASLIFSFRVTSVNSWVIALIGLAILAIVSSITMLLVSELGIVRHRITGIGYFLFWILLEAAMVINFTSIGAGSKRFKAITLNAALWLLPWVLPGIIMVINLYEDISVDYRERQFEDFIEDNAVAVSGACLVAYIIMMYFVTGSIKKWRGIAEG